MQRLHVLWLSLLITATCLGWDTHPAAAASGDGRREIQFPIEDEVVGTSMEAQVLRYYQEHSAAGAGQHLVIVQTVKDIHSSSPNGEVTIIGGLYNPEKTEMDHGKETPDGQKPTGRTPYHAFICVAAEGRTTFCDTGGSAGKLLWADFPHFHLQLAKVRYDACCGNSTSLRWRLRVDHTGGPSDPKATLHFDHPDSTATPTYILAASHGLASTDTSADNDFHGRFWNHREITRAHCSYNFPQCNVSSWDMTIGTLWAGSTLTSDIGEGVRAYVPTLPSTVVAPGVFDACMGLAPESRCGCVSCPTPDSSPPGASYPDSNSEIDGHVRWAPGKEWPLYWQNDAGSEWQDAIEGALSWWADKFQEPRDEVEIFKEAAGEIDILFETEDLGFDGPFAQTSFPGPLGNTEFYDDWDCVIPPEQGEYRQLDQLTITFNSNPFAVKWTDGEFKSQTALTLEDTWWKWRGQTARHEIGHALGIAHWTPTDCPRTGPNGEAEWHATCAMNANQSNFPTPVPSMMLIAQEVVDAANCNQLRAH